MAQSSRCRHSEARQGEGRGHFAVERTVVGGLSSRIIYSLFFSKLERVTV